MAQDKLAGDYELLDLRWDEPTSKPEDRVFTFKRHNQGEKVTLDEENARRLLDAGSVAPWGEREKNAINEAAERLRALLAATPDEVRARVLADLTPEELADKEVPPESLTVATATGLVPEGSPRVAAASSGEGDGGPDPQDPGKVAENPDVGENPGDGRVDLGAAAGVADSASASADDGTKTGRNARGNRS